MPAWWLNLQAAGEAFAVLGNERYRITPAIAGADERRQLWERLSAVAPIDHYQARTHRALPVVILRRSVASAPLRHRPRARLRPLAV